MDSFHSQNYIGSQLRNTRFKFNHIKPRISEWFVVGEIIGVGRYSKFLR